MNDFEYRKDRYINKNPSKCPHCEALGAVQAVDHPFAAGDFSMWQEVHCLECREEWYDIYHLVDIEKKESDLYTDTMESR